MILNSVFKDKVVVNSDEVFDNCEFVSGSVAKQKGVHALRVDGSANLEVKNCKFANKGYSAILMNSTGAVKVDNCDFDCVGMYNPIEGSQAVDNGNVSVKECEFVGAPGNNYINFYQMADGSEHEISGCSFEPTCDNNIVRISNRRSAAMKVNVRDCRYDFVSGEPTDYTGFMLCQDYTNKSGVKQDFSKVEVELDNVLCNRVKVNKDGAAMGCVFYVYEDGAGIITGENDPVVSFK